MSWAIEARGLRKTFGAKAATVVALDGVSFTVREGEIFAFLGPNGSGKTTTMNILADVVSPDGGEVRLLGKRPEDEGYFEGASFMTGDSQYLWSFTGQRMLSFYARLVGAGQERVDELVRTFGMGLKLDREWNQYSNGEHTRLRLIRALLKKPRILFLDEPSVGLDPDASEALIEALKRLNQEGMTIFLTSHYMKDVEALADRICFIRAGRIERIGKLEEFTTIEDSIAIEYYRLPEGVDRYGRIEGKTLLTTIEFVGAATGLGEVKAIRSVERNLEDYFRDLARSGREVESQC